MVKPVWNNAQRVNYQNFAKMTHPCAKKNLVLRAVLMKSGLVSINIGRQNISKTTVSVNTVRQINTAHLKITVNAARPMSYLSKPAHSTVKRPIHKNTTLKNSNIDQKVNTVSDKKFNTARPKAVVNAVKGNNVNAVKASACWVWKPKTKVLDHVSKHNSASITLKKFDYIDAQGISKNMSYLTNYEEIDGGYVAFGGNPKGRKITRKVPRKNNMYSVDLKNIVPKGGLTCLFAKATSDESLKLWHRRFTWVFFLATKDETSGILKSFITGIENLVDHKVKVIRCDNGTDFKNREMNQFCEMKETVNAACNVQNKVVGNSELLLLKPLHTNRPVESPQMVSTIKLPILKKVILIGDRFPIQVTTDEKGIETEVPPKTAQALLQRQRERKAKSILLLAIPDEYQLRFHGIKDSKSLWAAIKSRFGGNVESKKMQKTVLKQQFENFFVFNTEGLDKAYDWFQKLISLLEVHGAAVPNEYANQKFLRALPSSWNNVALIIRNKDGIDDLDIDDLYNNLKVFEADIKGSSGSSSNSQNVAFLSAEDTSSNNKVNTANGVSTASSHNSHGQASSSSYTDDLMFSFFANQSNSPQLDDEDLEQIDYDDLEEMDLKWQVAMLSL
ncbi:ribonuclease H-like domain-containing protein [Tanacetum coccineum]